MHLTKKDRTFRCGPVVGYPLLTKPLLDSVNRRVTVDFGNCASQGNLFWTYLNTVLRIATAGDAIGI